MSHWQKVATTVRSSIADRYDLPGKIEVHADADQVAFVRVG